MVTYFKLGWVTACFERKDLLKTAYFKVLTVINFTVPASSIRVFLESFKKVRLAFHGITEIFHKWTCTHVGKSCFTSRKDNWRRKTVFTLLQISATTNQSISYLFNQVTYVLTIFQLPITHSVCPSKFCITYCLKMLLGKCNTPRSI